MPRNLFGILRSLAYGVANNNDEDPFVVNVTKDAEVEPQFSQPTRQIVLMLFVLGIVGCFLRRVCTDRGNFLVEPLFERADSGRVHLGGFVLFRASGAVDALGAMDRRVRAATSGA